MFQFYVKQILFIESPVLLSTLLIPMSLLSVMRIPLLFFISGMGMFFSLQSRSWLRLLGGRTKRILEIYFKKIYYSLSLASVLFLNRLILFDTRGPHLLTSIESISWIIGAFELGYRYLNKPSKILSYLSQAAYPFYILHMIFLYWGAYIIFPSNLNV